MSLQRAALLAALTIAAAAARAEEVPRREIEEIVVTAQKTEQSAQDVPISISTIDGEFMKDVGATNMQDLAPYIPNLTFSSDTDPALAQINIRGFGTNPLNAAFESSVGFAQDDLFFGRPSYVADAMFDIERIEVLRGPQGTLFGKNTVAGVFNTFSYGPSDHLTADIRAAGAFPAEDRLEAAVGGPLAKWLQARVAVLNFDRFGELENTKLDRNDDRFRQQAGRAKLRLLPTDDVTIDLTFFGSRIRSRYWPLQLYKMDADTRTYLERFDPKVEDDPYDHRLSQDADGFLDKDALAQSMKATWKLGESGELAGFRDAELVLVAGNTTLGIDSLVDLDASPADIGRLSVVSDYDQQSVELRVAGHHPSGPFGFGHGLDLVTGGYFFRSGFDQVSQIAAGADFGSYLGTNDVLQLATMQNGVGTGAVFLPGIGNVLNVVGNRVIGDDRYRLDYDLDVDAYAWFGQATWRVLESWAITPGLRFNYEKKNATATGRGECAQKSLGGPCIIETALSADDYAARNLKRSESDLSPKVSLQYFWGEDATFFATWARGFKSGGFNGSSFTGDDLEFEDEKAATWEVGAKTKLFDKKLAVNLTLFRTEFENLQVLAFNGAFFDVANAGSATSQGAELDFLWLTPLDFLEIGGALGLLDATYDEYRDAPAPISHGIRTTQDLSGRPVALAPKETASLTPTVTLPLPFFGLGARGSMDFLYTGPQYTDTDLDPVTHVDGNFYLSSRVSVGPPTGAWSVTAGGSNLTDAGVANQILDTVFFPGTYNVTQKAGRKVFVAVTGRW